MTRQWQACWSETPTNEHRDKLQWQTLYPYATPLRYAPTQHIDRVLGVEVYATTLVPMEISYCKCFSSAGSVKQYKFNLEEYKQS